MTKAINPWPYSSYKDIFVERSHRILQIQGNPTLEVGAWKYYSERPAEFINDWLITYDPRNVPKGLPTTLPFILFPRQRELVEFLYSCLLQGESGLIEKSRDMGCTWLCCGFSLWLWVFHGGSSVGWGSRKEVLVDKLGDPDSIFEKIRMLIDYLPSFFIPPGFNSNIHCSYMKIINPDNGSTITGEAGNNIGRGGRKLIYFKDESAHYEQPEKIEAALGDNTNVQIDFSSVNGTANIFARRRKSGKVWKTGEDIDPGTIRVFIMDWRDHPHKTQEWYDRRREKAEREGLLHIFAQEVDRDYSAAIDGVLIPSAWVQSAVDLHKRFPDLALKMEEGSVYSALDVADEGGDLNAQADRKGITLFGLDKWAQGDTTETTHRAVGRCKDINAVQFDYDCIGVGAGIKGETNRLGREEKLPKKLEIFPWNGAGKVQYPDERIVPGDIDSPLNKDLFANRKAQAWWSLRRKFENTHKMVTSGMEFSIDELINIPSTVNCFEELLTELSQPTYKRTETGKIKVEKTPDGSRSPNLADAVNMVYFPAMSELFPAGTW